MTGSDTPRVPAPALSGLDRCAEEREQPDLLARLRAESSTRVVVIHGDLALMGPSDEGLRTLRPEQVDADVHWAFLGRDHTQAAVLVAATSRHEKAPTRVADAHWVSLRDAGGGAESADAEIFVEALALARWLVDARFCSGCGAATQLVMAGWSRRCLGCGQQHFPRTDPAVIVAVSSADDQRILLGKNALWVARNVYSTFAGFVEAGESAETAIVREVREEAGVTVTDLAYHGSQAWPYPRSLMLGYHAWADPAAQPKPDGVEIVDVRWFDRAELRAALRGQADFALPGTSSIAHRLITSWVERAR